MSALRTASAPIDRRAHLFDVDGAPHLFLSNGSRVYGLGDGDVLRVAAALGDTDASRFDHLLFDLGLDAPSYIEPTAPTSFPTRALSLAVAQKCNLGCTYCYAQGGEFGGAARNMDIEIALASVDRLFEKVRPGERVNLAFLGGEPLANREIIVAATRHAVHLSQATGADVGFSITTNGTLLTPEDGAFFEQHGFAVTVSLDGLGEVHDRQRPTKAGRGTFERIVGRVAPLLAMQRRMQISARVTVTPTNLRLRETLDGLIDLGFHSVGFSPMLSSPNGRGEMAEGDMMEMLGQMIDCGHAFEEAIASGERYPFANMATALAEIHRGTHRPYPCGAGGPYLGVSAEGGLFACHRFVNDEAGRLGAVDSGVDEARQRDWLASRHVDSQSPCRNCWARYLCGGGCHHEVIARGRPACDYIRGWLHYCLQAYVRLSDNQPHLFMTQPRSPDVVVW
ncbi:SPASM domain-containing protein (plasmid) [Rhizobium leguminosarum bv. trifolii]|uniref:radical SAM/SPASM domain-containing protein n=1 Tax=Rhizobium leguminosarum TaxID=384 RepID=UPI00140FD98A|nr:radical SAM protein [Rhizobium leguminosarum]QIO54606.1 SPASM domain-containing protein [Rhizobium leguminosarum bv. trifolii]